MKKETKSIIYKDATGPIEFPLKSDLMFHYVMQKSEAALLGLICSLKGISPEDVESLVVMNPISLNDAGKESVMDLKLKLNSNEIINIEIQMYMQDFWIKRSLLYLCRAYDSIKAGGNYSELKPTSHICITDQNLFEDYPEFYSRYLFMNTNKKYHNIYSTDLSINVLNLNHTDRATRRDKKNGLLFWAKLFKATTWEEFKALSHGRPEIEEVGNMIFTLNTEDQEREILEGQRRYREQLATAQAAGYIKAEGLYKPIIADLSQKNTDLSQKNSDLTQKNSDLLSELEKYKAKFGELD